MQNETASEPFARRTGFSLQHRAVSLSTRRWLIWVAVVAALFFQLGDALLFEPDEGRNAEKAREILVLQDWITPHENFHPVLDKPIFFYWLIALAYKVFGISEWAARLPSALAALMTLTVVFRFAQARWGRWPALWSILILLTSVQFFVLARVVIADMALTFFITLALCAFFEASRTEQQRWRLIWCLAMYTALGTATLVKGLIGVVVPALVILLYLLLTKQWATLARMHVVRGSLLFLVIVLSWYLAAEARNPGYLRYYLWDEHFGRFVTDEFDRGEPWYYFIGVALVGFLPWSCLLLFTAAMHWKAARAGKLDDTTTYLILWAALPFVIFSISSSKLPHYILPAFPPLALLTGAGLAGWRRNAPQRWHLALSLTWCVLFAAALFFLLGWFLPPALPRQIRGAVGAMGLLLWVFTAASGAMLVYMIKSWRFGEPLGQWRVYVLHAGGLGVFLAVTAQMMVSVAPGRSAGPIAASVKARLAQAGQVVFYDTYVAGGLFYLQTREPLLLVTSASKKQTFLGNFYALGRAGESPAAASTAILTFEEFRRHWQDAKRPLLVIVKEKNVPRMTRQIGEKPAQVGAVGEYVLVTKP